MTRLIVFTLLQAARDPDEIKAEAKAEEENIDDLNPVEAAKLARKLAKSGVQLSLKGDLAGAGSKSRKPAAGGKAAAGKAKAGGTKGAAKKK